MDVLIRPVRPEEIEFLCELDGKIFGDDGFTTPELWEGLEIFFIIVGLTIVGSIALRHNSDVSESYEAEYPYLTGSLYIVSTGILPHWQERGIGKAAKVWQLHYARSREFSRIVTNTRKSNVRSIRLNQKFGLQIIRTIPDYYEEPTEDAVVLELVL